MKVTQETPTTSNGSTALNFTQTNTSSSSTVTQSLGGELQELLMHHQNHSTTTSGGYNYICVILINICRKNLTEANINDY